jgi:hypothetical protein
MTQPPSDGRTRAEAIISEWLKQPCKDDLLTILIGNALDAAYQRGLLAGQAKIAHLEQQVEQLENEILEMGEY